MAAPPDVSSMKILVRQDQLNTVNKTVLMSIPINMMLCIIATWVAWHAGKQGIGIIWCACAVVVNASRAWVCKCLTDAPDRCFFLARFIPGKDKSIVERHLFLHCMLALCSGLVWASVPFLCEGYTTPETLFYLACVCGISAGAVAHGMPYARIPLCFITPTLLSVFVCLVAVGGVERDALAVAVLLYFFALIRSARVSEYWVTEASTLKHQATIASSALHKANEYAALFSEEMRRRTTHDLLTGLISRAGFMDIAGKMQLQATSPLCMMFLDLDGFKLINDTFGHQAGDNVLVEVSRRLQVVLSGQCVIARLGGDEFVILYQKEMLHETPEQIADRLIQVMTTPFFGSATGRVGVSIGICVSDTDDIDEMLVRADTAMYEAKRRGRNQYRVYDAPLNCKLQMKRDIQRDLADALKNDALEIWFQPIVACDGVTLDGYEALLRWKHDKHGWISPPDLIEVALLAGLSEMLFEYVLEKVFDMIRSLKELGWQHLHVAVNVSPREMERMAVDTYILERLQRYGLPASMLEVEITEESAMNIHAIESKLSVLASAQIGIVIDDFGTGYSSLSVLRQLHLSRVKIDRSFIFGLHSSSENQSLIQAVLYLSDSFNFKVVAEGIENQEDMHVLQQYGCHYMQGYYFSKALPKKDAIEWAKSRPKTGMDASHAVVSPGG